MEHPITAFGDMLNRFICFQQKPGSLLHVPNRLIYDIRFVSHKRRVIQLAQNLVHKQIKYGFCSKTGQISFVQPGIVHLAGMLMEKRREFRDETQGGSHKSIHFLRCCLKGRA
ncbi:hypothetical protein [Paenibacillus donghaensis]|uniref:hypothetical protein n=1 Tax=Paenibacillus donghaensis TaxID=414771 RepID=UPI0012F87779|nr:hypothetical protein [Paenibacillus donghaensis]